MIQFNRTRLPVLNHLIPQPSDSSYKVLDFALYDMRALPASCRCSLSFTGPVILPCFLPPLLVPPEKLKAAEFGLCVFGWRWWVRIPAGPARVLKRLCQLALIINNNIIIIIIYMDRLA